MKHGQTSWVAAALAALAGTAYGNGIAVPDIALSTQEPASLGGNPSFENDVLVGYNPDTDVAINLFDLGDDTGIFRNLIAAHELPNRNLVVSTQAGGTIGTLTYASADLLEINRADGTATMFLDTSAIGLVGNNNSAPNINAVHVLDDGTILFSTAGIHGVVLDGQNFGQEDVIAYNPVTQSASLFFDGSLITGGLADVLAFAVIDANHYLLAAFDEGPLDNADVPDQLTLSGVDFSRDDLILYNPTNNTSTLFMEGLNEFSVPGEIIDAVTPSTIPEPASAAVLLMGGVLCVRRRR